MNKYFWGGFFLLALTAHAEASFKKSCYIKPCEIKGDFDGDGKKDLAVLVQNSRGQKGIEIWLHKKTIQLGAGQPFGNGGLNFDWMDHWELRHQKSEPVLTKKNQGRAVVADSLFVEQSHAASAIIRWDGTQFEWIQQGD